MFFTFAHTVTSSHIATAPYRLEMPLSAGIIHQVDVLFQRYCDHKINVRIFQGNHQLWPTNPSGTLKGDATVVSFREFLELGPGSNDLHALIWTTDTGVLYEIIIQIGVLPKKIIQPLSFDELVDSLAGIE